MKQVLKIIGLILFIFAVMALVAYIIIGGTTAHGATTQPVALKTPPKVIDGLDLALPKNKIGVDVRGSHHTILNVATTGGSHGIHISGGASDINIDGFGAKNPLWGYGLFISSGGQIRPNQRIVVNNFSTTIERTSTGVHCVRIYATRDLLMEGGTLTHEGAYGGSSLLLKQVNGFVIRDLKTFGRPPGFGPNAVPEEVRYEVCNGLVESSTFDMNAFGPTQKVPFVFESGTRDIVFRDCVFRQHAKTAVLRFKGAYKTGATTRPAPSRITFQDCVFAGGDKLADGNFAGAKYVNCTYNGKALP